jgi:hypothetical protein
MGEIKSTLEIIMEKTKGLTLTEEEKENFRRKEVEGKVRGVLLKFFDGFMDLENVKKEIASFDKKGQGIAEEVGKKECLDRIDLEGDNRQFFDILEHVACVDIKPYQKILSEINRELHQKKASYEQLLKKKLQKRSISGSAVLANLNADQEWMDYVKNAKEEFRKRIKNIT